MTPMRALSLALLTAPLIGVMPFSASAQPSERFPRNPNADRPDAASIRDQDRRGPPTLRSPPPPSRDGRPPEGGPREHPPARDLSPPPGRRDDDRWQAPPRRDDGWRDRGRDDWRGDRGRDDWREHRRPGVVLHGLPPHARAYHHRGASYWFDGGVWYRPWGSSYVVARPPAGLWISALPYSYTVVRYGPATYYVSEGIYYTPLTTGGYEVATPPQEAYQPPIVYPAAGQSAQQQADDEYQCHRWAVGQSGFDPTQEATGQTGSDASMKNNYSRAFTACLEGRGYTVR